MLGDRSRADPQAAGPHHRHNVRPADPCHRLPARRAARPGPRYQRAIYLTAPAARSVLDRAAVWALPMTAAYLIGRALQAATWQAFALAPARDWQAAWHQALAGRVVTAFALTAPVVVPAGLLAAAGLWAWRIYAIENGLSGKTATAPVVFDARQWRRAARAARGRVTAPGTFPPHRPGRPDRDGRHDPRRRAPLAFGHRRASSGDGPAPGVYGTAGTHSTIRSH